jgi:N-acetylmuramoyl-L-alanine amidase
MEINMKTHTVKKGNCFASISKQYGFHDANILYSDAANASLKSKRPNMHVLSPKDKVAIPEKMPKTVDLAAETSTTFKVKGIITEFKLVVEDFDGNALADKAYLLDIEGLKFEGKTDGTGLIEETINAQSVRGELTVYLDAEKKNSIFWPLKIGCLMPINEISGIQSRLNNLGYFCANENGDEDESTKASVRAFKKKHDLADNDLIEQAVQDKLLALYEF